MRIKTGDKVLIIRGKNRGKTGKVLSAYPAREAVIVEGVNIHKKHVRPKKQGEKGQVVEIPGIVSVSNIQLICNKCGKATRVGHKVDGKERYRTCKKCKEAIS